MQRLNLLFIGERFELNNIPTQSHPLQGIIAMVGLQDLWGHLHSESIFDVLFIPPHFDQGLNLSLMKQIRDQCKHIKMVGFTYNNDSEEILGALREGIDDVLLLPLHDLQWDQCLKRMSEKIRKGENANIWTKYGKQLKGIFQHKKNKIELSVPLPRLNNPSTKEEKSEATTVKVSDSFTDGAATPLARSNGTHSSEESAESPHLNADPPQDISSFHGQKCDLVIYALGYTRIFLHGREVVFPGKKCKALFLYLALKYPKSVSRYQLMEAFWAHGNPDASSNSLNVCISNIRKSLKCIDNKREYILSEKGGYKFNPDINIYLDCNAFKTSLQNGRRLEQFDQLEDAGPYYVEAEQIYQGNFFEENMEEDWVDEERRHLKELHTHLLDKLSKYYLHVRLFSKAISYCDAMLRLDNCQEEIHRRLMISYYQTGKRHRAIRQFNLCVDILRKEMGVMPTKETKELYKKIISGGTF